MSGASRARGNTAGGRYSRRRAQVADTLATPLPLGVVGDPLDWSEARLQAEILSLCKVLDERLQRQHPGMPGMRVLVFHDTDSRRNVRGLPDLVVAGPGGVIFAELKREPNKATRNRAAERPEQTVWLDTLAAGGAAAYLWRPSDWKQGAIQNELYRIARPRLSAPATRPAAPPVPPRKGCGCPANVSPTGHTCEVWGPPS